MLIVMKSWDGILISGVQKSIFSEKKSMRVYIADVSSRTLISSSDYEIFRLTRCHVSWVEICYTVTFFCSNISFFFIFMLSKYLYL